MDLPTRTAAEVEQEIHNYFGTVKHQLKLSMSGRFAIASIAYHDFKPSRTVRRELEELIPNIDIIDLERLYSKDNIINMLDEFTFRGTTIYVKEQDGSLKPTSPMLLIEEELYDKTL